MKVTNDTIAAIATAPGAAAIAVVRLSGLNALEITAKIFASGKKESYEFHPPDSFKSNLARHGFILNPASQEVIDEVVLTVFRAPKTYTGEDLVEIACHGGNVVSHEILALLLNEGARLAKQGEFTERAFLNGRIDLTQAEAVLDLIQAKTGKQKRLAISALKGELGVQIKSVRHDLLTLLTRVVAGIDFPEEIGDLPEPEIEPVVRSALDKLDALAKTARSGRFLREGLKLAIVGRPNAGKSSLLNALLNFERAIVTDIPGTTRDSLEELIDVNGIPVILIDTAGIRKTEDTVEKIGIEKTKNAVAEADFVVFLVDLSQEAGDAEEEIFAMVGDKPCILVGNKIDLQNNVNAAAKALKKYTKSGDIIFISAKTGANLESLNKAIENYVFQDNLFKDSPSLNMRQGELCLKAITALKNVLETLDGKYPHDCLATDLKMAVDALSEISGELVGEEVITQVFANFCIGK